MTVNIKGSALSIPESLDSLRKTPLVMHRLTFVLHTTGQWYAIMAEARKLYGTAWRSQSHVRRKLSNSFTASKGISVWFEVPDPAFATWIAVKHAVIAQTGTGK